MCPSDVYNMPVMPGQSFGPEAEVFRATDCYPCSIMLKEKQHIQDVRIQVKTDRSEWKDYEEGDLIIGRSVLCRMSADGIGGPTHLKIEVFHT
ncbi:MAG: hypothetical protein K9J06_01280 [Flavobacteriales bacterium]|nr:hypothetical protein [Flavobacteriales bacterium]